MVILILSILLKSFGWYYSKSDLVELFIDNNFFGREKGGIIVDFTFINNYLKTLQNKTTKKTAFSIK